MSRFRNRTVSQSTLGGSPDAGRRPSLTAIRSAALVGLVVVTLASVWGWVAMLADNSSHRSSSPKAAAATRGASRSTSPVRPAPGAAAVAAVEALAGDNTASTLSYVLHPSGCQPSVDVVTQSQRSATVDVVCHESVRVATMTKAIAVAYQVSLIWKDKHWIASVR